jgi:hypothetical protein
VHLSPMGTLRLRSTCAVKRVAGPSGLSLPVTCVSHSFGIVALRHLLILCLLSLLSLLPFQRELPPARAPIWVLIRCPNCAAASTTICRNVSGPEPFSTIFTLCASEAISIVKFSSRCFPSVKLCPSGVLKMMSTFGMGSFAVIQP